MNYPISEDQGILQDSVRAFLAGRHGPARCRAFRAGGHGFDPAFWREMAAMGWLALRLPESLDGLGLSLDDAAILSKQLGEQAVADPYVVSSLMPSVILGEAKSCPRAHPLAVSLAGGDSCLSLMTGDTPLVVAGSRISGSASVHSAVPGGELLLLARDDLGYAILAIDPGRAGLALKPHLQPDGSAGAVLEMTGMIVTEADRLLVGDAAWSAWTRALHEGLIATAAQLTGLSQALLNMTVTYLKQRVQFGQAIATFQVIQHRLVDLFAAVRLSESSYRRALRSYAAAAPDAPIAIHAAKARSSDVAFDVARAAVQLHGALGYTDECDVSVYFRSAETLCQRMGNSTTHRAAVWARFRSRENSGE
jgi:alkylation response protein AidB-like acyl-CoA dehydrogenase